MSYAPQTTYDILEVPTNIPRDQLKKAFVQAQKHRKFSPIKLTQAYKDLLNGRRRLEIDLFVFSQGGDLQGLQQLVRQLPPCEFISSTLMPLSLPYERILLNDMAAVQPEVEIPPNPFPTRHFDLEPDPLTILPKLNFPR
jgi:hypothetical protein